MKQRCTEFEQLLTKRSDSSSSAQKLLLERDEQITQLLTEGEKLSKQQLQLNNVIKKLRSKEKELTTALDAQREKNEAQTSELDRLKAVLDNKCDVEKTQRGVEASHESVIKYMYITSLVTSAQIPSTNCRRPCRSSSETLKS